MKTLMTAQILAVAAVLVLIVPASAKPLHPSQTNNQTGLVVALRAEAGVLRDDARIYQWKRVGREVIRLANYEHKLQTAFPTEAEQPIAYRVLHQAVLALRSAATTHSPGGTADAARQVIAACDTITASNTPTKGN